MHPFAPYFVILLCLTPDNFTCQGENAAIQWVNNDIERKHSDRVFSHELE
jgi:hypothetical protein